MVCLRVMAMDDHDDGLVLRKGVSLRAARFPGTTRGPLDVPVCNVPAVSGHVPFVRDTNDDAFAAAPLADNREEAV